MFCAGCGITPYCSEHCQRRDWHDRHMSVCHNLSRMASDNAQVTREIPDNEPRMEPAKPLRRPHTNNAYYNKKENQERSDHASQISKASVKSSASNGNDERMNKSKQAYSPRIQDNDEETVKTTQPESPKKKQHYNLYNKISKTPLRQPAKNPEATQDVEKEPDVPTPAAPAAPAAPKQNLVPKTSPELPKIKPDVIKPQETIYPPKEPTNTLTVKPASVGDVTPTRKIIPKNYLIEKLSIGDSVIMSVESKASECRITRGDYVCLTMAEAFELHYQSLCEDFVLACDQDEQPYKLIPGETCSYFNPEDGGWYRARVLNPTTLALLDSGKIVTITSTDKCRKLPNDYEAVPEFCAVLSSKAVEVGVNINCKILSQTSDGYKISMADVDSGASLGEGEVFRWLPTVEHQPVTPSIPEVNRPPVTDGSKVVLVLANTLDRVFVRPADSVSQMNYNDVLQQVILNAMNAKPLQEPPQKGQTVIGKFIDNNFYRALVRRTNVKQNRYQIEYIEYGNIEVSSLENLYPCPLEVDLRTIPTQVSMVKLSTTTELTPAAAQLIADIKESEELVLTLPDGRKTAPSGSEANLTIVKNKINLNTKLVEMCTPEWKKIEERGGDVVETQTLMFDQLEHTMLPHSGCTIQVLDTGVLRGGCVSGYDRADSRADFIFNQLTQKMADYCNSDIGKEPYLPKPEELCIAKLPPYPQWFRAVFIELLSGPGSNKCSLCYLDYGKISSVPVNLVRKMMPEFIIGYPVMGLHLEIRDYPKEPSDEMLARASTYMNIDDEGRGTLKVTNCVKQTDGIYAVDAPELLQAMKG